MGQVHHRVGEQLRSLDTKRCPVRLEPEYGPCPVHEAEVGREVMFPPSDHANSGRENGTLSDVPSLTTPQGLA